MLYDITNTKPSLVRPEEAESYEVLEALRKKLDPRTFQKIVRTFDTAIDSLRPSEKSTLVWTRAAAIVGHGSSVPHADITHLWDNVTAIVGEDETCLKAMGGFLRWRISLRKETWLVYRRDTGTVDAETGKPITISEYWINNNFKVLNKKPAAWQMPIQALAKKWNARIT